MKILASFTSVSILLVAACSPQQQVDSQATMTTPPTPTAHSYLCESGTTIVASYPSTETVTVNYKGNSYHMSIAVSASGARYVGDELEWWTKGMGTGSEGTLFRHMADGTSGDSIENCTE